MQGILAPMLALGALVLVSLTPVGPTVAASSYDQAACADEELPGALASQQVDDGDAGPPALPGADQDVLFWTATPVSERGLSCSTDDHRLRLERPPRLLDARRL